jgi:hypothetical protein
MNKQVGTWVALGAVMIAVTSGESEASIRYRTDAHECFPQTAGIYTDAGGLHMQNGAAGGVGVGCSVPTGAQLVDLGDGNGHPLAQINMRLHQSGTALVQTIVRVRDHDSASRCTCGNISQTQSTGYFFRNMPFNCGACSYGSDWAINVGAFSYRDPDPGTTTVKLITVYD